MHPLFLLPISITEHDSVMTGNVYGYGRTMMEAKTIPNILAIVDIYISAEHHYSNFKSK